MPLAQIPVLIRVEHPIVSVAYLMLAGLFLFVRLPGKRETWVARISACAFFLGCAGTHFIMVRSINLHEPVDPNTALQYLTTTAQVFGAAIFILVAGPYMLDIIRLFRDPGLAKRLRGRP